MPTTRIIAENQNFKAIDIGPLNQLSKHEFVHPVTKNTDKARLFTGEILHTTGAEVSFRELPPDTVVPFLHKHQTHEEIYIFLKGKGKFQVDKEVFPVREGSIVKVALDGNRTLCNDSDEIMLYMVVQARAGTLSGYNVSDGYRVKGEIIIS